MFQLSTHTHLSCFSPFKFSGHIDLNSVNVNDGSRKFQGRHHIFCRRPGPEGNPRRQPEGVPPLQDGRGAEAHGEDPGQDHRGGKGHQGHQEDRGGLGKEPVLEALRKGDGRYKEQGLERTLTSVTIPVQNLTTRYTKMNCAVYWVT